MKKIFFLFLLFLFFEGILLAQSDSITQINIEYSDLAKGIIENGKETRTLEGNVELSQDSVYVFCDTAQMSILDNLLKAYGNVSLQNGDSITTFADSIVYFGNKKVANLIHNVILKNGITTLFTEKLKYDLKNKVATYVNQGLITQNSTQIQSDRGLFQLNTKDLFLKGNVSVIDNDFELQTDTLIYNTHTEIASYVGPTRIVQKDAIIYCEAGSFNTKSKEASFFNNAQFRNKETEATADTIRYNSKTGIVNLIGNAWFKDGEDEAEADFISYDENVKVATLTGNASYFDGTQMIEGKELIYNKDKGAFKSSGRSVVYSDGQTFEADAFDFDDEKGVGVGKGNFVWRDTTNEMTLYADEARFNKKTGFIKAFGTNPPILESILDLDSMFMVADTFIVQNSDSISKSKILIGYNNVMLYKSDLQAKGDSVSYNEADSMMVFYQNPVAWSDSTQFLADTITMKMKNNKLDSVFLQQNAMVINTTDMYFFNQIGGKNIDVNFKDNRVEKMLVIGNAQALYYMQDEKDAYVGVNKMEGSEINITFIKNKVKSILCFPNPNAKLQPMQKANHEELKLKKFKWLWEEKPVKSDLIN